MYTYIPSKMKSHRN